jgi:uncharacterized protein (DUF362 family)/NAD-dependent dihydropyrimidine dehydrogenase PreA subunit
MKMGSQDPSASGRVMILDAAYDASMERVVAEALGEFSLDWKGKRALVKPNILAPYAPEAGVTTHPTLVRAVVRQLRERGAEVLVGDSPGLSGYGDSDYAARKSGIIEAAEGGYVNLGRKAVKCEIASPYFKDAMIAGDVIEADYIVNLPKFKTHGLTILTGALKNTFGYVLGGNKMKIHSAAGSPRNFAEALLDIYQIKPPQLNIMDAVVAMEGNGPSKGALRSIGKVLASDNAVALDAVMAHLIGQPAKTVPLVDIAGRRGLGENDVSKIKIIGQCPPIKDFKLPSTFVPGLVGVFLNRFLSKWVNCVPEVMPDLCQGCGVCVDHCPVQAMAMKGDCPQADLDKCINCYCCQEMCPEGAIKLTGRMMRWLRGAYNPRLAPRS